MGLRMKKANVTHKELAVTVQCPIIGVKKNPNSPMYTQLGVLTRGVLFQSGSAECRQSLKSTSVLWDW
jgi:ribosome biogenesis protein NSA2